MRTKKMIYGGLLTAVGLVLPQAFHVFGQGVGMAFLPMHLPVMIAGILLGPCYGGLIGLIVPLVSSMLTGMPPVPKLYFMFVELVAYGIFTGIFIRKMNVYFTLLSAMILGRVLYGCSLIIGVKLLGFHFSFANMGAFLAGIVSGIPGMILQITVIPLFYFTLKKGGWMIERDRGEE